MSLENAAELVEGSLLWILIIILILNSSEACATDGSLTGPVYYLEQNFAPYALDSTASTGGSPGP
jgi:hypothetical protein